MAEALQVDRTGRRNPLSKWTEKQRNVLAMKVWQLRVRRLSWGEISAALGMSPSGAKYLFEQWKRGNDQSFNDLAAQSFGRELIEAARGRLHTLDALYRDTKQDQVKIGALNAMRAEYVHIYEMARDLGMIQGAPQPAETQGVSEIVDAIRSLAPGVKVQEYANRIRSLITSA